MYVYITTYATTTGIMRVLPKFVRNYFENFGQPKPNEEKRGDDEMLFTFIIGLICGGIIVHKAQKLRGKSWRFKVFGYEFAVSPEGKEVSKPVPVVDEVKERKQRKAPAKPQACGFCNDEDIYVGGDSKANIMPCPKCGRNESKVKTKVNKA